MTIALELNSSKTYRQVQALRGSTCRSKRGIFMPAGERGRKIHDHRHHQLAGEQNLWSVNVFGYDLEKDVVNAKRQLGLVPQGCSTRSGSRAADRR